ncbi:hypothetical protein DV451_002522 [Geotrichum candidum]|uniref:Uncharacterized protein n=1 Tax=Geotrichum candidum TaxID=1173061 RepID=A0A9P5G4K0_GEOCN|nr:hypothetical protein DV451_002522 [Geotrichum candidum]
MDPQVSYHRKPSVAAASWNMSANSHHLVNTPHTAAKSGSDAGSPPTPSPASMSAAVSSGVRLDIYHPTLNTGISDIRIQDAVLEYPIVRALIIPECDLEARRRCIGLISNVIKAANPVLHFVLLQQKQKVDVVEHYNTLTQFLSTVPTKESLVRFWFMHYMEEVRNEVIKVYGHADKLKPSPASTNSGAAIAKISLTALYAKIRRSRDVLQDLADRVQGAVCIVFWESWDGIYQELAEIVGDQDMEAADKGRIFRASGTAAIYINRRRVERRAEEQRRAREKHLPKTQEATSKHGIDTALLTPPDMMDTFIDFVDDAPKPVVPVVEHDSPNMIQIKNSPIASPEATTETGPEDGKGSSTVDHDHWPFKLLTAPIANKNVELIDTTELEEVMNDKRAASAMVDNTEHSELRKRIRLMEN